MTNGLYGEIGIKIRQVEVIGGWQLNTCDLADGGFAEPRELGKGSNSRKPWDETLETSTLEVPCQALRIFFTSVSFYKSLGSPNLLGSFRP